MLVVGRRIVEALRYQIDRPSKQCWKQPSRDLPRLQWPTERAISRPTRNNWTATNNSDRGERVASLLQPASCDAYYSSCVPIRHFSMLSVSHPFLPRPRNVISRAWLLGGRCWDIAWSQTEFGYIAISISSSSVTRAVGYCLHSTFFCHDTQRFLAILMFCTVVLHIFM